MINYRQKRELEMLNKEKCNNSQKDSNYFNYSNKAFKTIHLLIL